MAAGDLINRTYLNFHIGTTDTFSGSYQDQASGTTFYLYIMANAWSMRYGVLYALFAMARRSHFRIEMYNYATASWVAMTSEYTLSATTSHQYASLAVNRAPLSAHASGTQHDLRADGASCLWRIRSRTDDRINRYRYELRTYGGGSNASAYSAHLQGHLLYLRRYTGTGINAVHSGGFVHGTSSPAFCSLTQTRGTVLTDAQKHRLVIHA